jgi:hypothetical protein
MTALQRGAKPSDMSRTTWWEWYLTSSGWREGKFLGSSRHAQGNGPLPVGTVLVVRQYADASTGVLLEYSEETQHGSNAAVRALRVRFGSQPPTP